MATAVESLRIASARNRPIVGWLPEFRRDATGLFLRLAAEYGEVVHFRMGPRDIYLLDHPDLIRDVLVQHNSKFVKSRFLQRAKTLLGEGLLTAEGQHHLRQRRLSQPAFHRDRLAGYALTMVEYAGRARNRFRHQAECDLDQEMMRLTLGIVAKTLFNADVEGEAAEIGAALNAVMDSFQAMMLPFSEYVEKIPFLPLARRLNGARSRLDATIYRIIAERRASQRDEGDLLSILIQAQDDEDGTSMSDRQVRDEALTLFLAGHETTANALTWTWYLLSQHPEVERRFHEEIDRVLGSRLPGFDDYPRLPYTEMVLAESMRLYPPAWAVGRRLTEPYELAGVTIAPGAVFAMSQWITHRNPRYWPEPERFDPDRFLPEAKESRPKFAYFPFGGGPRVCIGERFAWLEGVLILATIGRQWRFRLAPGHVVEVNPVITLRTKYGLRVIASER